LFIEIALVACAFIIGSIPTSYIVGQLLYGIDIRRYGSGNVGSSNIMQISGKKLGLAIGIFDTFVKGTIPIILVRYLYPEPWLIFAMAVALVVGHNWSIFLKFTGGRGVATTIGVVFGLFMWKEILLLTVVMGGIGKILSKDMSAWTFCAMILLPLLGLLFNQPIGYVYLTIVMSSIMILKRLTGNFEKIDTQKYSLLKVLFCRIIWDRDMPDRQAWMRRKLGN
jgi:glycerol-3-phosphate acyltransferase PlsY|tara:strand:- start:41 stop:712 length:672 start_codon:yes stop_codon:yes gene_type:complete